MRGKVSIWVSNMFKCPLKRASPDFFQVPDFAFYPFSKLIPYCNHLIYCKF